MGVTRFAHACALVVLLVALCAATASAGTPAPPAWTAKINCAKLMPVSQFAAITATPFKTLVQSYSQPPHSPFLPYEACGYRFPSAGAPGGQAQEGWSVAPMSAAQKALDVRTVAKWDVLLSRNPPTVDCSPGSFASGSSGCGILHPYGPNSWLFRCDIIVHTATWDVGAMFCAEPPADYDPTQVAPGQPSYQDQALIDWAHAVLPRLP